jgi:hypothetical protein
MYFVAECITMSAPSSSGRVGNRQSRIARAFDPQQLRLRQNRRFHGTQIGGIDERDRDSRAIDDLVQ